MPTRGKEWFLVISTFTRLHGTETVGCSVTFLFQVCSIHSGALSCLCVFRDGSEQVSGVPCLYVYVSELVNLLTLSDVCWSGFHVEGIKRKETRISVFLQTYLFRGRFPLDQFNPVCIISLFCHNGFIHFVGPLCSMPASAFKVNFEVPGIQVIYWYRS